jgi:quercetin dioxygenase-like cupin family protein
VHTVQTGQLDLVPAHHRDDEANVGRAAWPVHHGTGSRSTAAVYFELDRGMRLGRHTDSAEELLVVRAGEVDVIVGDERRRVTAGGMLPRGGRRGASTPPGWRTVPILEHNTWRQ